MLILAIYYLGRAVDSTGLKKLKCKLECWSNYLFETVRPASLWKILYQHKENNYLYKDIIIKPISGELITFEDTRTNRLDTKSDNEDETSNLTDLLVNQLDTNFHKYWGSIWIRRHKWPFRPIKIYCQRDISCLCSSTAINVQWMH